MDGEILKKRQEIIAQLTQARLERGMTQAELAELIGTQRSNISRIESGAQNLTLDMMLKISTALGKDVSLMLTEQEKELESRYILRIYDTELMRFSLKEDGLAGLQANIISVNDLKSEVMPLDMELSNEGLVKWLKRRVIPKNRAFVEEILKTFGLNVNDTKGIIDVCKGLSLNDSYWIIPEGFEGSFGEYNLYENRFSEILSLVAYTGVGQSHRAFTTSPELTTQGMLRKAWRYMDGEGIWLYKGGTEGAVNAGNEPYSEYYACQIAQVMGLNAVHYDLENWKGILASKCRLFTDIDTAYIPIGYIVRTGGIKACLDYYESLGAEFSEQLKSMLVFDAVIYNEDRHFGNFGVLRDNRSGKLISPAPIFDNGVSLFNYAMMDDLANIDEYAKTRSTPYNVPFETIVSEVAGKEQARQLRRLIGFTFKRHPNINLPEERLELIERHLQKRVSRLLALTRSRSRNTPER